MIRPFGHIFVFELNNKILRVDYGTHSVGAITAGQTYRETIKYNFEFKNAPIPSFAYNSRELSTCHTVPYVREMHASYFVIEFIPDVTSDVCNISWFAVGE